MIDILILRERQRVVRAVDARARRVDQMCNTGVTTTFEHGAEHVDVVAQIGPGVDERIAHPRLRGEMRDVRERAVAQQRRARHGVGEIERIALHAGSLELPDTGSLEPDVVIRVEVVDAGDLRTVALQAQREVHADKTGGAGNQNLHLNSSPNPARERPKPKPKPVTNTFIDTFSRYRFRRRLTREAG